MAHSAARYQSIIIVGNVEKTLAWAVWVVRGEKAVGSLRKPRQNEWIANGGDLMMRNVGLGYYCPSSHCAGLVSQQVSFSADDETAMPT